MNTLFSPEAPAVAERSRRTACTQAVRRFIKAPPRSAADQCQAARCKRPSVVVYVGVELCARHRDQVYDEKNWPKVSVPAG